MSTLQELLKKKQAELLASKTSSTMSLAERIALQRQSEQKSQERTENAVEPIKPNINTNIGINQENKPNALKIALPTLSPTGKPSLSQLLANKANSVPTTQPVEILTPDEIASISSQKSMQSLAYRLAQAREQKLKALSKIDEEVIPAPIQQATNTVVKEVERTDEVKNIKETVALSLLERIKLKKILEGDDTLQAPSPIKEKIEEATKHLTVESTPSYTDHHTFALDIVLNEEQEAGVELVRSGKSGVILGAAGTGKTTSERAMMHAILDSDRIKTSSFKLQGEKRIDAPSVAIVAYTRRASANSAKAILKDPALREQLPHNIMTIHALLEFEPVVEWNEVLQKETFRFVPMRDASNPLDLTHLIIEEATLLGLDLWEQLYEALPTGIQIIFVGDINQLPPVFGPSILNYALTRLPVVELVQVYRQAEGSPIINNAHNILRGESLVEATNDQGKLVIIRGKNQVSVGQTKTSLALGKMFEQYHDMNLYNPDEDIILSPWNKKDLGTDSMNKFISEFLGMKRKAIVHEVIAGFSKLYFAEGDKVMYNKRDALIVEITKNPAYIGMLPQLCGEDLSRWGYRRHGQDVASLLDEEGDGEGEIELDYSNMSIEDMEDTKMERKMQCSHSITIAYEDGSTAILSAVGDFSPQVFSLGYALTVHKSQGSEWRRVFIILHKDHAISCYRELLYTAITRAREEVYIIAKDETLEKCIKSQRVKGNTLKDKIEFFNSGIEQRDDVNVTK